VAAQFAEQFKVSLPILVDTIDDQVEKAYAGWPDRLYVIDPEGKIAYKSGPGPRGFLVTEARAALEKLLGLPPTPAPPGESPAARPTMLPPQLRARIGAMLGEFGVAEKQSEQVLSAIERKVAGYRALTEARAALYQSAGPEGDPAAALARYQDAVKRYTQEVEKLDREIDAAIGYSKNPRLQAALTAVGLLGATPASPVLGPPQVPTGARPPE
jgi:hypothetical protein